MNTFFEKNKLNLLLSLQIKFLMQRCCLAELLKKYSDWTVLGFGAYSTSENLAVGKQAVRESQETGIFPSWYLDTSWDHRQVTWTSHYQVS